MMRSLGRPSALQLGILHRDSVPSPQIRFAQPCAPCLSLSETTGLNQERSLSLFLQVSEGLVADSSPTVAGACLGPWDGRTPEMQVIRRKLEMVAKTNVAVLV